MVGFKRLCLTLALLMLVGCTEKQEKPLRLIYTGGLAGYLEPCGCREGRVGGLARLAGAVEDSLKLWRNEALVIDAGDFAETYVLGNDRKNRVILQAYARLGYDAVNVSSLDLMAGEETLRWAADSLRLPLISCNLSYKDTEKPLFPGWVLRKIGRQTMGIIGVGSVRPLEMRRARAEHLRYLKPEEALPKAVEQIRSQCDLVIVLCDFNARTSREMAAKIKGIDLVISSLELPPSNQVRKYGYACVVGPARKGKALTILTLRETSHDSLTWTFSHSLLDSTFKDDPQIARLITDYQAAHSPAAVLRDKGE